METMNFPFVKKGVNTTCILFFLCICLATSPYVNAQTRVMGKVESLYGEPLHKAVVQVLTEGDHRAVQGAVSDSAGHFVVSKLTHGKYYVKISFIGYQSTDSKIFETSNGDINLGIFKLIPADYVLDEIVVESKQKTIEQQEGKVVVNLKNSAAAGGTSALEVLERLPNINVDRQNSQISLAGKEGSIVMINGKRTYMPNAALLQLLSGINASKIDKIELIANPSAALDAEGNAGVINIVMSKTGADGVNGSVEAQAGYGRGSLYNLNGDFSYTKNKLSLYAAYSFARQHQAQTSFNSRVNTDGSQEFSIATMSERDPIQRNHNVRLGMDYQVNKNAFVSALFTLYDNKWSMNALNRTDFYPYYQQASGLGIVNDEINHWKHAGGSLSFQQKLKNNRSFSTSVDYLYYHDNNPTYYNTSSLDPEGTLLGSSVTRSTKVTPISILVPQLNYTAYSSSKLEVQAGAKASLSRFNNDVSVGTLTEGTWADDPLLTSQAELNETILAGFAEANYTISEATAVKGGLRYEHTMFDLSANVESGNVKRNYGSLFPSLLVSHRLNANNLMSAFYARRINRPTFNDIAPFVLFIDPYTFFSGNPAIQPSYTHTVGINYTLYNLLFSASYSNERNSLAKFQISVDPLTNMQTIRPENLGRTNTLNAGVTVPIEITDWWTFQSSLNGLWKEVNTGAFQDNRRLSIYSMQLSGSQQFKFLKHYSAEVSGFYNTATLAGTSKIQPFGGITAGLQRKINNSILRVNVNDVFNSIQSVALISTMGYDIRNGYDFSQRTFKVSYLYTFGNRQGSGSNAKNKGAEEERKRVQ